jgi:hypothetical protein
LRVIIADPVGIVTDRVARRFVVPRLERVGDRDADPLAQILKALFSDFGEFVSGHLGFSLEVSLGM